jgi:hypothetical protein
VADVGERVTLMSGRIVTLAELDFVGSAVEVTVTNTCAGMGTVAGARYKPVAETVPHAVPLQPLPVTLHETALLDVPLTVAENWWEPPMTTCAELGEMLTEIGPLMVTVAVPDFEGSATEVAVTDTWGDVGETDGAV